jgi:enoyl-CoA hydratase
MSAKSHPNLLVSTSDGIRTVTLHRPEARNAVNRSMREAIIELCESVDADTDVRVLVITGTDPAFSGGVDLKEISAGEAGDAVPTAERGDGQPGPAPASPDTVLAGPPPAALRNPASAIRGVTKPVIAAVNGFCYTGALEMVVSCDIVVASDRATFADTHAKFGLMPFWGMSALLPERVGVAKARELSLTGRPVDAAEALRIGLADHLVGHDDLLRFTHDLAGAIAAADPDSVVGMQRLYDEGRGRTVDERLALELEAATRFRVDLDAFDRRQAARKASAS